MSKILAVSLQIFLIAIIFFRLPEEYVGLNSFANKSTILGSPASAQRFLNNTTAVAIFLYFAIAFQLNLAMD